MQGLPRHEDGSARVGTLASIVDQFESLSCRHVHELRINALDELLLDGALDVGEDLVVFDAVQLSTELL